MNRGRERLTAVAFALLAGALPGVASSAELTLQGARLVVTGVLDGSATQAFVDQLSTGAVRTVVFKDSVGGTAEAAAFYARAIRSSGVNTEALGQCHAACAYAFLAGKEHRFGRGPHVNRLFIPTSARPRTGELTDRWRGDGGQKALAEFTTVAAAPNGETAAAPLAGAVIVPADAPAPKPVGNWKPDQGVLFSSTPTLFGRVYKTFYCDGTQGRDFSKCEALGDADPYTLGVLTR